MAEMETKRKLNWSQTEIGMLVEKVHQRNDKIRVITWTCAGNEDEVLVVTTTEERKKVV